MLLHFIRGLFVIVIAAVLFVSIVSITEESSIFDATTDTSQNDVLIIFIGGLALSILVLCHELGSEESGIPFHRNARSAALKLLSNLPPRLREHVGELTEAISIRLDAHNPLGNAKCHYETLTQALARRQQVRFVCRHGSQTRGSLLGPSPLNPDNP